MYYKMNSTTKCIEWVINILVEYYVHLVRHLTITMYSKLIMM